jgi:hypothetical protein
MVWFEPSFRKAARQLALAVSYSGLINMIEHKLHSTMTQLGDKALLLEPGHAIHQGAGQCLIEAMYLPHDDACSILSRGNCLLTIWVQPNHPGLKALHATS